MTFRSISEVAAAQSESGRFWQSFVHKTTQPSAGVGLWADGSVGSGTPIYNAYVGPELAFSPLVGVGNKSIYLGPDTGASKRIAAAQVACSVAALPANLIFADYLGFYPFVDLDSTDLQVLTNPQTLPRYDTGDGVFPFLVMQTPGAGTNAGVTMTYTNSDGVSGRSVSFGALSSVSIGVLANQTIQSASVAATAPWIPRANGDRGVRSVESIQFSAAMGGFAVLVLCRPLFSIQLLEATAVSEVQFIKDRMGMPELLPGAFLQFVMLKASSTTPTPFRANIDLTWS